MRRYIRYIAPLVLAALLPFFIGANWLVVLSGSPPASVGYTAYAASFNGATPDWMERDGGLTGATDTGKRFIFSCWVNFTGGDGTEQSLLKSSTGTRFVVNKRTTNLIRVIAKDTAGAVKIQIDQNSGAVAAITAATGWVNICVTGDNTVTTGFAQMYINGVSCGTVTTLGTAGVPDDVALDFVEADWAIGATAATGAQPLTAEIGEIYFNGAESIDLSSAPNLAKFISGGIPPGLGADGSTPTGTAPLVYMKGQYTAFTANSATGGNFVNKGGTLGDGGTIP